MYHVKLFKSLEPNTFYRQPIIIVQFALMLTNVNCKSNLYSKDFTTKVFRKEKEEICFAERDKKSFLLVKTKR